MAERRIEPASPDTAQEGEFSNLPNEIVAKIFLAGTEIWREFDPQGLPFPVLVSGVCAHWRLLSRSTPDLWTVILPPLNKDPDECLSWTSNWFERSGAMLVSVVLDDRTLASGSEHLDIRIFTRLILSILDFLANNVHRLRRLDIQTTDSNIFEKFTQNLQNAPHLQQLSLCARQGALTTFVKPSEDTRWSSLLSLPSLTRFRFQNISPPFISNLTSLIAHNLLLNYEDVRSLFTACPNLADLVLHKIPPIAGPIPTQTTPIEVPSLRSIAVSSHPTKPELSAVYLFSFIVVPNLVYLEVEGNVRVSLVFKSSLLSSKIRTLRIAHCSRLWFPSQGKMDLEFYHSFSGLRHLEIIRAPAGELLLKTNSDQPGLERRRSINLRRPSYRNRPVGMDNDGTPALLKASSNSLQSAEPHMLWPEIRSITLDTILADDLVSLVNFTKIHKNLQSIHLSSPAMRHLSQSLRRNGDVVFPFPSRHLSLVGSDDNQGTKDVTEWLSKLTEVKTLQVPNYGHLDADRVPLSEML